MERRVAVIGLGYVGLPVALALAKKFTGTVGFDVDAERVRCLSQGTDTNGDTPEEELKHTTIRFTSEENDLADSDFFVVAVPTPIDGFKRPDLNALSEASRLVGRVMEKGAIVVYESTVYPGVTEEVCGPIIELVSGLRQGMDFKLGYSPERINPGDREHTLERITKVVSGEDEESLDIIAAVYGKIIDAGVFRASSIKVAESAKVIENTQRDLNIALMNELALIFDRLGVSSKEVLDAAGTKWNFLPFKPGLVGGHCIGVDPYYLTTKAEQMGYRPQVILAGRRINDGMGQFIAQRVVKLLINAGCTIKGARIGILGVTFKENVSDIRNSRVPDIVMELAEFGVDVLVHDPCADADEVSKECGIALASWAAFSDLDAMIYAVPHKQFQQYSIKELEEALKEGGIIADVKSEIDASLLSPETVYWSL